MRRSGSALAGSTGRLSRSAHVAALVCAVTLVLSCAGRRPPVLEPPEAQAWMGVYRARVESPGSKPRKFRLLLFAEPPDRIHGEVVSAIGSTVMIFDGGAGRLAVTLVRERLAFVGEATDESLERVLGVRCSLADLVADLLYGMPSGGGRRTVVREAPEPGRLPERLSIVGDGRSLSLELKKLRSLRFRQPGLGTGEPPAGLEVRPLRELQFYEPPGEIEEEGKPS